MKKNLTDSVKKTENLYLSHICDLSLAEFIVARKEYCRIKHGQSKCNLCAPLITFANELLEQGVVPLAECFRKIFSQEYKSDKAIRRIMQLPIVVFRVNQKLFVAEYSPDMNYEKFMKFFNMLVPDKTMPKGMSRETLKMLCDLSSSEKDKKLIRFAASSRISATKAKKELGISDLIKLKEEVADGVEQYRDIRDAVKEVVHVRERLSLKELGVILSETDDEVDSSDNETSIDKTAVPLESDSEREIVTDLESDNPEDWVPLKGLPLYSEDVKAKIKKQRDIFRRQKRRRVAKLVCKRSLLERKKPARMSKTVKKYPDIGNVIEDFARERRTGADSWWRTGLLTFSGNLKRGPKLTYHIIQKHLQEKYNTKFGYGTVVQLCCAHNKRKLSSKRYWGAAKIVSRRARKGFNVKLNVDAKWSCSMYKILDYIQSRNGLDKVVISRDDAAGFRLDTTFTHKQHPVLQDNSNAELTTRTDFLNKYSSLLQTTSYLFMETENTPVTCVGVVKPQKIYPKHPGQHAADLNMLSSHAEVKLLMEGKKIECIRVDGAMDESPSLQEVQFQWTERHFKQGTLCTIVTSRYSGGSYLSKVELQNGCLALGHSNVFIPSTIHGSNMDADGKLCYKKLKKNMDAAADVYINTVSGTPCFGTQIHLVKGAADEVSELYCDRRAKLLAFLRGSKKAKENLRQSYPQDFQYFSEIWEIHKRHMVPELPTNYLFMLLPCYHPQCSHPECTKGKPLVEPTWYPGGPPLSFLPLPIPDPLRPWGGPCEKCVDVCTGHFLKPEDHIKLLKEKRTVSCQQPPRGLIEQYVNETKNICQDHVDNLAKSHLLSLEDAKICVQHFVEKKERKKRNGKKRNATKKTPDTEEQFEQSSPDQVYCICRKEEDSLMVQCDSYDEWFHGDCISVPQEEADLMENYFCSLCLEDTV